MAKKKDTEILESTVESKLKALYALQKIDSEIDKIRIIRGELPLEVQDLEDEIAGLETREKNFLEEISQLKKSVSEKETKIKESKVAMEKYEKQQRNVRNSREYDSLLKEVEFQGLEIQLCEKRIKEYAATVEEKKILLDQTSQKLKERKEDIKSKKKELNDIVAETEKDEKRLMKQSEENEKIIEDRLITAYKRIRAKVRNGLAVVVVDRDACGGCFNKIPPQRQLDIRNRKKIIVCEYCGRLLVDSEITEEV